MAAFWPLGSGFSLGLEQLFLSHSKHVAAYWKGLLHNTAHRSMLLTLAYLAIGDHSQHIKVLRSYKLIDQCPLKFTD